MTTLGPLFARQARLATRPATIRRWHWSGPATELLRDGAVVGVVRDRRIWGAIQGLEPEDIARGGNFRWIVDGFGVPSGCGDCATAEAALLEAEAALLEAEAHVASTWAWSAP